MTDAERFIEKATITHVFTKPVGTNSLRQIQAGEIRLQRICEEAQQG
jgi:hypothetical protein